MSRDNEILAVEDFPAADQAGHFSVPPDLDGSVTSSVEPVINESPNKIKITQTTPRARRKLGESRQWLRAILDASPDGMLVEEEGKIILANHTLAQMLGYETSEEFLRANSSAAPWSGYSERIREFNEVRLREKSSPPPVFEFKAIRQDESQIELEVAVSTAVVAGKTYIISTVRPLGERGQSAQSSKESEERLQQSQKMEAIGTLTGGVAHDFNNLLTAIIGNTQLALVKVQNDDALRHRLTEIEKATNRAAVLTRQLLAFSRRQQLERRTINLNDAISEIIKLLRRIIGEDIEVSVEGAPDLAAVFADPAQIEQVVMNLCINAREAMPGGGRVTIETCNVEVDETYQLQYPDIQPGKYVQISVSDNGCGMDAETKARIFEPFFTTKGLGRATGLGLSMAYGIVKQHGGVINVESEIGQGATFKIFLPVEEKTKETESLVVQPSLFGGTETVLVAEDEEALRNLAEDVLGRLGYKVLLAKNGEEAVEIYAENRDRIDLLLFDMVMPRMGGAEAYERIKAMGGEAPLIFMTGYSSETLSNRFAVQNKFNTDPEATVIQKPYNVQGLGHKIREILDTRYKQAKTKGSAG